MRAPTAFSWGYSGWGAPGSTAKLVRAFDAAEALRGFAAPVFVDVRARRNVRAVGFREDAFERAIGRVRQRWMSGLGNAAVLRGGKMRLVRESQAFELLGLVLAEAARKSRVVFFCSCASPERAPSCHRRLVERALLAAAGKVGARVEVEEWPGGAPQPRLVPIDVPPRTVDEVLRGGAYAHVPEPI